MLQVNEATLTIGEVARQAGVTASAIRYYEAIGVLPQPERQSGRRVYTWEAVRRLQVLGVAKQAGFALDEAKVLLQGEGGGSPMHEQLQRLARRKLPEVDAAIARAQARRDWLEIASRCECETLDACALFAGEDAAGRYG